MNFLQTLFLTVFFSWKLKPAPWTWGSIASFLIALVIFFLFWRFIFLVLLLLITIISIPIINNYEKKTWKHDNSEIVIDELVWVFLTILIISFFTVNIWFLLAWLIFFRIFDIWKPSLIWIVDKKVKWWLWVMLDDILAWIFAWMIVIWIFLLFK